MKTVMNKSVSAPGKSIIEKLNFFTALALGAISAIVVWRLALQFLPQDVDGARLFSREDKITLLSMTAVHRFHDWNRSSRWSIPLAHR